MKLRILFLLLPILIFSQKINWQSKVELNTDDKYHFESSFENFESSFLQQNKIQVNLPVDSSNFENFVFYKQNPFSEKLYEKFKEVKVFRGKSLDSDKISFISFVGERINISILDDNKKSIIINSKNKNIFILKNNIQVDDIKKSDLTNDLIDNTNTLKKKSIREQALNTISFSPKVKKYRIAIITTAEWSNYFIDLYDAKNLEDKEKRAVVLSEIGIAISALNGVTERDLGITFELVDGCDDLIEFDTNSDGLTNDDKFKTINEGAQIINSRIGLANFDIGHSFYNGGGGLAGGALCGGSGKARGTSGGLTGIGFHFVFAHEIGHMLGAPHTFNNAEGFGAGGNMVESAAGATIMGYGERKERNLYYHALSIKEMSQTIKNASCGTFLTENTNESPKYVSEPEKKSFTIPAGTPFLLGENFEINDNNNKYTDLLFNWDQMNAYEITVNPPLNTSLKGPTFISLFPDNNKIRYFPDIETILSGKTESEWEVVPQLSRNLKFTFTVRDDNKNGGSVLQDDFTVQTKYSEDGVFMVLSQHVKDLKYHQKKEIEIRWNHLAAKDTENVNIELSYDGGYTFPVKLSGATKNDGFEKVTIPLISKSKKARIRVKPTDNIFFSINPHNFEILDPEFKMNVSSPEEIICFGDISEISINPTGGAGPPYKIKWEKLSEQNTWIELSDSDNDPKVLSNLKAGKYKTSVTDIDNNIFESDPITVSGPLTELFVQLENDINKEISCVGNNDGYLNISTSGGSPPYTLFLNNQVIKTNLKENESFKINNLKAGDFSLRVIDDNGCKSNVLNEKITEPENALNLKNFSITNPSEGLSDGAIDIEIEGGTKDYNYSWTSLNFSSSDEDLTGLSVGTYLLTVTDGKGCEFKKEFILELSTDFNYNISITQINCFGESSGIIETKPKGGSGAPYKIEWYDSNDILISTSSKLNNIKAGTYKLQITDSENNVYPIKTIELTEPPSSININLESKTDIKCKNDKTGEFNISIVGGIAPYNYFVNNELVKANSGNTENNKDELVQSNLKAGLYNITVIDAKNCSTNFQVSISEPEFLINIFSEKITNISKYNTNDGSIEIIVEGGLLAQDSNYSFNWTGPNDYSSTNQNLTDLAAGKYILVITDDNSCSLTKEFNIKTPTDFSFTSISTTMPKCYGGNDGTISVSFEGGYGEPYTVNWFQKNASGDFVAVSAISDTSTSIITKSGVYKVEVIDNENIKYMYGTEIIVDSVSEFIIDSPFNVIPETCPGDKDGSFNIKVAGGTGPYSYYLNDNQIATGRGNAVDNNDEFKVEKLEKKGYSFYAIDSNGCVSNPVIIGVGGNDPIQITNPETVLQNIKCYGDSTGYIKPVLTGGDGTGVFTYSWLGPNGFTSNQKDIENIGDAGKYSLTVSQGVCSQKFDYDVLEPNEMSASLESITNNICYGDAKGGVNISIKGGTAPYKVKINDSGDFLYFGRKGINLKTISKLRLPAGKVKFEITDFYDCKTIILEPEVLQPKSKLVLDYNIIGDCEAENSVLKLKLSAGDTFLNDEIKEYYKVNITSSNFNGSYEMIKNEEFTIENLKDGNYLIKVTQRDFQESNDSQEIGCVVEQQIYISNKVIWDNKTIQNITCVNEDIPTDDGSIIYKNIRGGTPFVLGNKTYKYELLLNEIIIEQGTINQDSDLLLNNLKKGKYSINFIGNNEKCIQTDEFEITQPVPIDFKVEEIFDSCKNALLDESKGAIKINIKHGTAPYKVYVIDQNNIITNTGIKGGNLIDQGGIGFTSTVTGLGKGKYKIKIIDSNDCEFISNEISVGELDEFVVSNILFYDVECFGGKNGSIDIGEIKGGQAPYSVLLEGTNYKFERNLTKAVDNYIIDGLEKNNYKLTIKDKNGWCGTFQKEFSIREPELVKINILNIENQKCYDFDDGKIKIDLQGGMLTGNEASYLTKWYKNDVLVPQWNDKLEIDNLGFGFFRIDAIAKSIVNGKEVSCSTSKSFEIKREDRIIASENIAKHVDISCNGGNDGQFEVFFTGGAPPYKVISNGSVIEDNLTNNVYLFKEMLAGDYEIDIADANDCKFSESINDATTQVNGVIKVKIQQPEKLLDVKAAIINASCTGSEDGEIIINVSGGKPPYSINWNLNRPYKELESNPNTGYFKISTGKGSVFPTVTDVTNFCGSISSNLVIDEPQELKITEITKKDNVCVEGQTGEYEIYPNGLFESIYSNEKINWFKIEGNIKKSVIGLNNIKISDSGLKATNLPKGNYQIEIKANHFRNFNDGEIVECLINHKFEIKDPKPLILNEVIEKHQNIVCESSTGSIVLNIKNGSTPYRVQINDNLSQEITLDSDGNYKIENLTKGEYKIIVFDNLNCKSAEVSTEILEIAPVFDISNISTLDSNSNNIIEGNKPECYNGLGSFYFEISENQSSLPLKFYLDNIEIFIDNEISFEGNGYLIKNISLGKKELKVVDENGACRIINFEILNQEKIRLKSSDKLNYIKKYIACSDEQDNTDLNLGIIDVTNGIIGGQKFLNLDYEYKFNWTGPNFSSKETRIEVTEPGIYNLVVTDSFGCESEKLDFDLSIEPITANPTIVNYSCDGELGSISIDPKGGTAPYLVQWYKSNEEGKLLEFINGQLKIDKLNPGYYSTIIVDNNGCQKIENHKLISEELFIIEEPVIDDELCLQKTGYLDIKINNPWDTKLIFLYDNKELTYTKNNVTEDYVLYHVKIEEPLGDADFYVKNEYDCTYKLNLNLGVGIPGFSIFDNNGLEIEDFGKVPFNRELTIKNNSIGKYFSVSYDLSDGSGEQAFLREDDQGININYKEEGYYNISLKLFNPEGCFKEIRKTILVGKGYWFKVPNAFTPNNDGINDVFRPIIRGFVKGKFNVFSISGIQLHEETFDVGQDYRKIVTLDGWRGDNRINSDKVYYYLFEGTTLDEEKISKSGYFKVLE